MSKARHELAVQNLKGKELEEECIREELRRAKYIASRGRCVPVEYLLKVWAAKHTHGMAFVHNWERSVGMELLVCVNEWHADVILQLNRPDKEITSGYSVQRELYMKGCTDYRIRYGDRDLADLSTIRENIRRTDNNPLPVGTYTEEKRKYKVKPNTRAAILKKPLEELTIPQLQERRQLELDIAYAKKLADNRKRYKQNRQRKALMEAEENKATVNTEQRLAELRNKRMNKFHNEHYKKG